jgi:ribosomal protein S6--L-glutamate ligase
MGLDANILAQEFIKEAGGEDLRCLVAGGKVIAAMKRTAQDGEFRANLHRSGTAALVELTPGERSTALRAAKILGLNVYGVDLLRSNHDPSSWRSTHRPG